MIVKLGLDPPLQIHKLLNRTCSTSKIFINFGCIRLALHNELN